MAAHVLMLALVSAELTPYLNPVTEKALEGEWRLTHISGSKPGAAYKHSRQYAANTFTFTTSQPGKPVQTLSGTFTVSGRHLIHAVSAANPDSPKVNKTIVHYIQKLNARGYVEKQILGNTLHYVRQE